jgi:hypothetical protein
MLKNMSFLALAGSLAFVSMTGCILVTDDTATTLTTGDGDGDGDTGTGTAGDGDGAPGDGDGAPGDGDGAPGDGDGAPGDGDGAPGDGDGAPAPACGWVEDPNFPGYYCDGTGEADPSGTHPIACPENLVAGEACDISGLTGEGCCDANGDNWYCGDDMMGGMIVVFQACGG